MRKILSLSCTLLAVLFLTTTTNAQTKSSEKKKETVELKPVASTNDEVAQLKRPENDKNNPQEKSRGDVYGSDYSDIIVDNWTGWYVDVYVDGTFRGTLEPYGKKVTWAIPGNTTIYAKATFTDGSYRYWSHSAKTGYEYTLQLFR